MNRHHLIESLETRRLLAALSWDGGGDGTTFEDPLNWSTNVVPGAADDVTVDVAANPTIVISESRVLRSLNNSEVFEVTAAAASRTLTITQGGHNSGTMVLTGTGLGVSSLALGSTFTNSGTIRFDTAAGSAERRITLNQTNPVAFVNDGIINVTAGTDAVLLGNGAAIATFTQNGNINVDATGQLIVQSVSFDYVGGTNSDGLFVASSVLDLVDADAASTLSAVASNTLAGFDSPDLTLAIRGDAGGFSSASLTNSGVAMTMNGDIDIETAGTASATLTLTGNVTNQGTIGLTGTGSGTATFNIGGTFTNVGTVRVDQGSGTGGRNVRLNQTNPVAFVHSGTLDVTAGTETAIQGSGATISTFTQNGTISVGAGGELIVQSVSLNYVGGTHTSGFFVTSSLLDLDDSDAALTLTGVGSNTLAGHDAANLTLSVAGNGVGGFFTASLTNGGVAMSINGDIDLVTNGTASVNLTLTGLVTNNAQITLTGDDTGGVNFSIGGTFTNDGTIRIDQGSGTGTRLLRLNQTNPVAFVNNGTLATTAGTAIEVTGIGPAITTFTQNGLISVGAGGQLIIGSVRLNYVGGAHTSGLFVTSSVLDLNDSDTAVTLVAVGSNTLAGHDAANLTLTSTGNAISGFSTATLSNNGVDMTFNGDIVIAADGTGTSNFTLTGLVTNNGVITLTGSGTGGTNFNVGNTFTNNGSLTIDQSTGSGAKIVRLNQTNPVALVNNGTIDVAAGTSADILGNGATITTLTQNGQINVAPGSDLTLSSTQLDYIGGSNTSGLLVTAGNLNLLNAASSSEVVGIGTNLLLAHAAANLTLAAEGGVAGNTTATIRTSSDLVSNGPIILRGNGTSAANLLVGGTFTNNSTVTLERGTGSGGRTISMNQTTPAAFVNVGTVAVAADVNASITGTTGPFINTSLVSVADGARLALSGQSNLYDAAGTFLSGGRYVIADGGELDLPNATVLTAEIEAFGSAEIDLLRLEFNRGAIRLLDGADVTINPFGNNTFQNQGIIDLSPTSVLDVIGDMTFGGVSQPVIRSEIASLTDFGRVNVSGSFDLNSPDSTSRFDPDLVGGFDPEVGDSFAVITATGGVANGFDSFQGGEDPSGDVLAVSRPNSSTVAVAVVPGPLPPAPQILDQAFEFQTRLAVTFTFDQDVSAFLSRSDYTITNVDTGEVLPQSAGVLSFNSTSNQAVLDLTGSVPNGNYQLVVQASDIANGAGVPASGSPITLDFFVLAGDANRDRQVSILDFAILRGNFGTGSGATFTQGDFNYDGSVSILDFAVLRANFGQNLPVPMASLFATENEERLTLR